jgi:hypothetical protein
MRDKQERRGEKRQSLWSKCSMVGSQRIVASVGTGAKYPVALKE